MTERKLTFTPPFLLQWKYGRVEKPKAQLTGNRLWNSRDVSDDLATITRAKLFEETKGAIESDLNRARLAGDWGKVNRCAALLSKLTLVRN